PRTPAPGCCRRRRPPRPRHSRPAIPGMYRSPACLLAPDRLSPAVGHGSDRGSVLVGGGGLGPQVEFGTVGLDLAPDGERAKPERGEHDEFLHSEEPSTSMTSERSADQNSALRGCLAA